MNADKIIETLEENDFGAKEWTADEHTRVYVTRTLSRGRRQEMGYISVAEDGSLDYCLTRASARIRSLVEKTEATK